MFTMTELDKNLHFRFLTELDNALEGAADKKRKIKIMLFGGSALTILNMKRFTKDIDFIIDRKSLSQYHESEIRKLVANMSTFFEDHKAVLKSDALDFYIDRIVRFGLPDDYLEYGMKLPKKYKYIEVYLLSLEDIIVTKIDRFGEQDKADIISIMSQNDISLSTFEDRFELWRSRYQSDRVGSVHTFERNFEAFKEFFEEIVQVKESIKKIKKNLLDKKGFIAWKSEEKEEKIQRIITALEALELHERHGLAVFSKHVIDKNFRKKVKILSDEQAKAFHWLLAFLPKVLEMYEKGEFEKEYNVPHQYINEKLISIARELE